MIEQASNEKQALGEELDEARRMMGTLKGELEEKGKEALEMKSRAGMSEARVLELEEYRASAEGKSVRELEQDLLKAKAEEIGAEAVKKFQEMKADWERSEKPKEVLSTVVDWLNMILDVPLEKSWIFKVFKGPLSELGAKVVEILKSGVKRGLDEEFDRRVEAKSDSVAHGKLRNLVNTEWPNWLRANVDPKVARLEGMIVENVFRVLGRPRILRCDRCGTNKLTTLTDAEIENMTKGGIIRVKCANPQCVNATWFRLKLTLADVIRSELC